MLMRHLSIFLLLATFWTSALGQTQTDTTKIAKAKQLLFDTLHNRYDSLLISISYDYSIRPLRKFVTIKRTNSSWTAIVGTTTLDFNAKKYEDFVKTQKTDTLNPKNGWDSFLSNLFSLQVTTLPTMDSIPGLTDGWTDGISYHVVVATQNQYNFYSYHLPDHFQEFWQAKNMTDILKLIKTEFGVDWK